MKYKKYFYNCDGDNIESTKQAAITDDQTLQNLVDTNTNKAINDNIIWLYDEINDTSLYKVKNSLNLINHAYDKLKLQYQGILQFTPIIHMHIASSGGDVFSGLALYDAVKNNRYCVYTHIDGFCASAATFPFLAGAKRFMSQNSLIMIHQISTWFVGDFSNLKDQMQTMTKLTNKAKTIYLRQSNMTQQELDKLLSRDVWLTKQQAEKLNFCEK